MTLTKAAVYTKRGMIGFIALIILIILVSSSLRMWNDYQIAHRPKVEEKPEMKFGALPKIAFPNSNISSSNYSYTMDTVTGGLPETPKLAKIYFIPQSSVTLLAPDRASKLATNLGFPNNPEIVTPTKYRFTDEGNGKLTVDLTTGNFYFQRPIASSSANIFSNPFIDKDHVIGSFKNYLSSNGLLSDDIKTGRADVVFDGQSPAESKMAIASIWPQDLDKVPIVTTNPHQSLVKATVTTATDEINEFVEVHYTLRTIDKTTSSTYPLKTAEQALTDLKSGLAYIHNEPPNPQISISSIYLAYLEQEDYTPYLQPVFVFEGSGFTALVPASLK